MAHTPVDSNRSQRVARRCDAAVAALMILAATLGPPNLRAGGGTSDPFFRPSGDVPRAIPDAGTIVSTAFVPPPGFILGDVDVSLNITHTFDDDLDVFLESPSGTIVELFTDVGDDGDDFNGTVLDDEAILWIDSGGGGFPGSWVPEGQLSDFDGESAIGVWKLHVTDDSPQDVGTLNSWGLILTPQTTPSHAVPRSIPDQGTTVSRIVVPPGPMVVGDINVDLDITHTHTSDLDVFLQSPAGTTVELFTDVGVNGVNFVGLTLNDESQTPITSGAAPFTGEFRPEGSLASFDRELAQGVWTLTVTDDAALDTGSLERWALTIIPTPGEFASQDGITVIPDNWLNLSHVIVPRTGALVSDVNVTLDITHTWDDDLDVLLISPSGTVVELFTDVGGSGDNFSGTVLDDEAPISIASASAPFAGTFAPEGMLSDFDGESAGGVWELSIADDSASDTGTLNAWTLRIETGQGTFESFDVPEAIPDNGATESDLIIPPLAGTVRDVNVALDITHPFDSDLSVFLSRGATFVSLFNGVGDSGDNFTGTVFDDEASVPIAMGSPPFAGSFQPAQFLSMFDGQMLGGTWRLNLLDNGLTDVGQLNSWSLSFTDEKAAIPPMTIAADLSTWTYYGSAVAPGALGSGFPGDGGATGQSAFDLGGDSVVDLELIVSNPTGNPFDHESLQGFFSPVGLVPFLPDSTYRVNALVADQSGGAGTRLVESRLRWFHGSFGNLGGGNAVARPRVNRPRPQTLESDAGTVYHLMFDSLDVASASNPAATNPLVEENDITLAFETIDLFNDYGGAVLLKNCAVEVVPTSAITANQTLIGEVNNFETQTFDISIDFGDNAVSTAATPSNLVLTTSVGPADGGQPLLVYGDLGIELANAERSLPPAPPPASAGLIYRLECDVNASANSPATPLADLVIRVRTSDDLNVPLDTTETRVGALRENGAVNPGYSSQHTYAAYHHFPDGFIASGVDPDGPGDELPYGSNLTGGIALEDTSDGKGGSVTITGMRLYTVPQSLLP